VSMERDLIFPHIRGRDVHRWSCAPSHHIIVAQDPATRRGVEEKTMQSRFPKTYAYLKSFEPFLRSRAAFMRYFTRRGPSGKPIETGPFYSMFDVSNHTFAGHKVLIRQISEVMKGAVA